MVSSSVVYDYFDQLNDRQKEQIDALYEIYSLYNSQVNVISRKDMDNFYIHHVLHSMSLSKFMNLKNGFNVIDIGTGGGFPGIPLAIMYPDVQFHLVDSIGKKVRIVDSVCRDIGITNVETSHCRVEEINERFDLAVARAVAPSEKLVAWMKGQFKKGVQMALLKGGDLTEEMEEMTLRYPKLEYKIYSLYPQFKEDFFETKKAVLVHQ